MPLSTLGPCILIFAQKATVTAALALLLHFLRSPLCSLPPLVFVFGQDYFDLYVRGRQQISNNRVDLT